MQKCGIGIGLFKRGMQYFFYFFLGYHLYIYFNDCVPFLNINLFFLHPLFYTKKSIAKVSSQFDGVAKRKKVNV